MLDVNRMELVSAAQGIGMVKIVMKLAHRVVILDAILTLVTVIMDVKTENGEMFATKPVLHTVKVHVHKEVAVINVNPVMAATDVNTNAMIPIAGIVLFMIPRKVEIAVINV